MRMLTLGRCGALGLGLFLGFEGYIMKTSELTGVRLDLVVAKCEGRAKDNFAWWWTEYRPSFDWSHGGPIIEREKISVWARGDEWAAESFISNQQGLECVGLTPLVAAMRCYVASKLGDYVDEADIQAWL